MASRLLAVSLPSVLLVVDTGGIIFVMSEAIEHFQAACEQVGGRSAMASHLAVHRTLVDAVCRDEKPIPERWCPIVESITTGGVRCEALRPDLPWGRIPDSSWPGDRGRPVLEVAQKVVGT